MSEHHEHEVLGEHEAQDKFIFMWQSTVVMRWMHHAKAAPLLSELNHYSRPVIDGWYLQSRGLFLPTDVAARLTFSQ